MSLEIYNSKGIAYWPVEWKANTFKVKANIINGDSSGRTQDDKKMLLEYVGTFFQFSGTLVRMKDCTDKQWDDFFTLLTQPKNDFFIRVPFRQGYMYCSVYISSVNRTLKKKSDGLKWKWKNEIDVTLTPTKSQWLASLSETEFIGALTGNQIYGEKSNGAKVNRYSQNYTDRPPWDERS